MEITLTTAIIAILGVVYIGYIIGTLHGIITMQRHLKGKDDLIKLYQEINANLIVMTNGIIASKMNASIEETDEETHGIVDSIE